MPEESRTPDLVELSRRSAEAFVRRDFDAALSIYAPAAVWDSSKIGMGTFEGTVAIRSLFEDWIGSYAEFEQEVQATGLGNAITFLVLRQKARPAGSTGFVELRYAVVAEWAGEMIKRVTAYTDLDEACAAAVRLVESRG